MADLTDDELAMIVLLADKPGIVLPPQLAPIAEALADLGLAEVTAAGEWSISEAGRDLMRRAGNGEEE